MEIKQSRSSVGNCYVKSRGSHSSFLFPRAVGICAHSIPSPPSPGSDGQQRSSELCSSPAPRCFTCSPRCEKNWLAPPDPRQFCSQRALGIKRCSGGGCVALNAGPPAPLGERCRGAVLGAGLAPRRVSPARSAA